MDNIIELLGKKYLTSASAARYLGLSRARISALCKQGKFTYVGIGNNKFIPVHEIERYKALENTNARKPGKKSK